MIISTNWITVKAKKLDNSWTFYYLNGLEHDTEYLIVTGNSINQYYCRLLDAYLIEFNNNHKSNAIKADSFNDAIAHLL